jgi:hypothetical protein
MPLAPPIYLAAGDGSNVLDVVIWIVAAILWVMAQAKAARKRKMQKPRPAAAGAPRPPARAGDATPSPDELTEIFKRLGADIPQTPPPATHPPPPPPAPARSPRPKPAIAGSARPVAAPKPAPRPPRGQPPARINSELARRLARAKQEAAVVAPPAMETPVSAKVQGVESQAGDHRATRAATRTTGLILPPIYALGLRLSPLPTLPIPGFERAADTGQPLRVRLRSRRELRDAIIAQVVLRPPKSSAP